MRPLCTSYHRLQSKSYVRGLATYKSSLQHFEEDHVQSSTALFHTTARQDEEGESTSLNSQSSQDTQDHGRLTGKKAIITGASRGIGAAIAQRFAKEGAKCVLVGRNVDALTQVREGLMGPCKADHVVRVGDVGSLEFWKDMARSERRVDILVNAAGITHYTALFKTQPNVLEEVARTNLMGTMLSCRNIGRLMMGKRSSGGGLKGGMGSVGYAASKAGVIGLTRALASEVGREGIRVNVIVPGYIQSDMTAAMTPQGRSKAIESIPLGRFGEASEVADAAIFLATNKYANNCVLNLDGGLSAT